MEKNGEQRMGRVVVKVDLANHSDQILAEAGALPRDKIRQTCVDGIVDTGVSYLVLPARVVTELGLPSGGQATVRFADRRSAARDVAEEVSVKLLGRQGTFNAIVEPNRDDALIGAIVLEVLDLIVDCRTQTLQPRDPKGIVAEIE